MKNFHLPKFEATRRQWIKMTLAELLLIAFTIWVQATLCTWLFVAIVMVPVVFDLYITRKIKWGWWRNLKSRFLVKICSWIDAIVFALIAVSFINIYFFQNYTIPSSSLEKSLLTGDYLFVSKLSYGPRKPITPLALPLMQHTTPWGGKSYLEWPMWEYERIHPQPVGRGDIVVFNFPAGDTIVANPECQNPDFYTLCYSLGQRALEERYPALPHIDTLSLLKQREYFNSLYASGRRAVVENKQIFGEIGWRPIDRRENYVKRCVGLPGDTLRIVQKNIQFKRPGDRTWQRMKQPDNVQFTYNVSLRRALPDTLVRRLGLSQEDLQRLYQGIRADGYGIMPLTQESYNALRRSPFVEHITPVTRHSSEGLFPLNGNRHWTVDNYGPVWIPQKGDTLRLTLANLPLYERCITAYEGNTLTVDGQGDIYINGAKTDQYVFRMGYYWMMGDNRHCSADSRFWGFVPEDHIVGKPIMIWLSLDPDRSLFDGKIRWDRMFRWVEDIN